jgi:hypothetical protein
MSTTASLFRSLSRSSLAAVFSLLLLIALVIVGLLVAREYLYI